MTELNNELLLELYVLIIFMIIISMSMQGMVSWFNLYNVSTL